MGHHLCLSKACVAAVYSDFVLTSSHYMSNQSYHPLEELKVCHSICQTKLSSAEIARTTVEANTNALLVFPGMVHCEPDKQISWTECQYLTDVLGDIYIEIFNEANILEDLGTSNPVNALIGMDIPIYDNGRTASEYKIFNCGNDDRFPFDDDYVEVVEFKESNIPVNWKMPDTTSLAVKMECGKKMVHPSDGVSIVGYLISACPEEESYLRMEYHHEVCDGHNLHWKDRDAFFSNSTISKRHWLDTLPTGDPESGVILCVWMSEFQKVKPDVLVHSTQAILERFNQRCDVVALKALCKKKGPDVEGARLSGVDSLGIDVRAFSGTEVKTHRFPFKVPATSAVADEKQIQQLLFPRSPRKMCLNSWQCA